MASAPSPSATRRRRPDGRLRRVGATSLGFAEGSTHSRCARQPPEASKDDNFKRMPTPRPRTLGQDVCRPLAAMWAGGSGPTHAEINAVLWSEGIDPTQFTGSKQDKIASALGEADDERAVELVTGFVGLLRDSGWIPGSDDAARRKLTILRDALARRGGYLDELGNLDWTEKPRASEPVRERGQSGESRESRESSPASASDLAVGARKIAAIMPAMPGSSITAFISWAHTPNPDVDQVVWLNTLVTFSTLLRFHGVDADIDLYHQQDSGIDWAHYGPTAIESCQTVIVAVNHAWGERWKGTNSPTVGAGAAAEANALHGLFSENQQVFREKVYLVVLPGASEADIPLELRGLNRFTVPTLDTEGIDGLLRALTSQPAFVPPRLGSLPILPPREVNDSKHGSAEGHLEFVAQPVSGRSSAHPNSPPAAETAERQRAAAQALEQRVTLLRSALAALTVEDATDGSQLPWRRERVAWDAELNQAEQEQAALLSSQSAEPRLAEQLETESQQLTRADRVWLQVALTPARVLAEPTRLLRDKAREQVADIFGLTAGPLLGLSPQTELHRQAGGVVFTGRRLGQRDATSTRWRLHLHDHGGSTAALVVSVDVDPTGDLYASPDKPGDTRLTSSRILPILQERLEIGILAMLDVLRDHAGRVAASDTYDLTARLLLPPPLESGDAGLIADARATIMREVRDVEHEIAGLVVAAGAVHLPLNGASVPSRSFHKEATRGALEEPQGLVSSARQLAAWLLDEWGVEDQLVLTAGNGVDELMAPKDEQQAVYQWAQARGLPVRHLSPLDRRLGYQRYRQLAREEWRP